MLIGSIKEQNKEETRTAITPNVAQKLIKSGHAIILEKGIGKKAGFDDNDYLKIDAKIFDNPAKIYQKSQIILQILPPTQSLIQKLNKSQILIADFSKTDLSTYKIKNKIIRLEQVPRLSNTQNIDILSSQSLVRGYMAAVFSLYKSQRIAPQIMTAAASIKALSTLILGASLTGLQAASTLKRIGCLVTIFDINKKTAELAVSVGAKFTHSPDKLPSLIKNSNIIIGSATNATGDSPEIINSQYLPYLDKNSLIVDTTENNINLKKSPTLHFYQNPKFERMAPTSASELWANNMFNLITLITTTKTHPDLSHQNLVNMLYPTKPNL